MSKIIDLSNCERGDILILSSGIEVVYTGGREGTYFGAACDSVLSFNVGGLCDANGGINDVRVTNIIPGSEPKKSENQGNLNHEQNKNRPYQPSDRNDGRE